jgi:hypothetical protein
MMRLSVARASAVTVLKSIVSQKTGCSDSSNAMAKLSEQSRNYAPGSIMLRAQMLCNITYPCTLCTCPVRHCSIHSEPDLFQSWLNRLSWTPDGNYIVATAVTKPPSHRTCCRITLVPLKQGELGRRQDSSAGCRNSGRTLSISRPLALDHQNSVPQPCPKDRKSLLRISQPKIRGSANSRS